MKKKLTALFLLLVMVFTMLPWNAAEAAETGSVESMEGVKVVKNRGVTKNSAEIYTEYLLNGGYQKIEEYFDKDTYGIESCYADFDGDGYNELLLHLIDKEYLAPSGYYTVSALLDIVDENVIIKLSQTFHGGVEMDGPYLLPAFDAQKHQVVIKKEALGRDSQWFSRNETTIYSAENGECSFGINFVMCRIYKENGYYVGMEKQVRQETNLFVEDDEYFYWYLLNEYENSPKSEVYISEQEFDNWEKRFRYSEDINYQLQPVTYENPIPAHYEPEKILPDYSLSANSSCDMNDIPVNQEFTVQFTLKEGDALRPIENCTVVISDPHVIKMTGNERNADGTRTVTLKGLKSGTASVTFTDMDTGESTKIELTAEASALQNEWIREHKNYAQGTEYETDVVPHFIGHVRPTFTSALDDGTIKAYNMLSGVTDFLNAKGSLDEGDMYQLILGDLLYSQVDENLRDELYLQNLQIATVDILSAILDGEEVITSVDKDTLKTLRDNLALMKTLQAGTDEFAKAYTSHISTLTSNVDWKAIQSTLSGNVRIAAAGILLDKIAVEFKNSKDILQYIYHCLAYQSTSEEFREVLRAMAAKMETLKDSDFAELNGHGKKLDLDAMQDALNDFISSLEKYEQSGAEAFAEQAAEMSREADEEFESNTMRKIAVTGFDTMVGFIPVLNTYNTIKTALQAGRMLTEVITNADERSQALDVMTRLYGFTVLMDRVVEDYAQEMTYETFEGATLLDEAVNIYRSIQSSAAEYSILYVEAKLEDTYQRYLGSFRNGGNSPDDLKKIENYQDSLKLLKENRTEIESILCHDPWFDYDPADDTWNNIRDSRIYWVACPVDVKVLTPDGETLAVLSDTDPVIPEGYEGMFCIVETEEGSGDYMKVAVVPKDHQIVIDGQDSGEMDILVMEYTQDGLTLKETYQDVPVTADTQATFEYASDHPAEAENNDTGLLLNGVSYAELQRKSNNSTGLWIAVAAGGVVAILAVIIFVRKRKKQTV